MAHQSWSSVHFHVPLNNRPQIVNAGLAQHGHGRVQPPPREVHCHRAGIWAIHCHQYRAELAMAGTVFPIRPGYLSLVAPQVSMDFRFAGPCQHYYVLFALPGPSGDNLAAPAMRDLGIQYEAVNARLARVVSTAPWQAARAEAELWLLLWDLLEGDRPASTLPQPVAKARQIIEARLAGPICVAALARELGISHNQLNRQFHGHLGHTVSGYITSRRVEKARQLLVHTTRPVKSIAAEVGFKDIQALNKCLRRLTGHSPRQLRQGAMPLSREAGRENGREDGPLRGDGQTAAAKELPGE